VLVWGAGNSIRLEVLRMTIYKSARLFASASQRKLRASIANTPVEVYERCHQSARSSSRVTGDEWLSPRHFPHRFHITLKTLNSNRRVRLIPVQ
jgi:hypothetical protein